MQKQIEEAAKTHTVKRFVVPKVFQTEEELINWALTKEDPTEAYIGAYIDGKTAPGMVEVGPRIVQLLSHHWQVKCEGISPHVNDALFTAFDDAMETLHRARVNGHGFAGAYRNALNERRALQKKREKHVTQPEVIVACSLAMLSKLTPYYDWSLQLHTDRLNVFKDAWTDSVEPYGVTLPIEFMDFFNPNKAKERRSKLIQIRSRMADITHRSAYYTQAMENIGLDANESLIGIMNHDI